MARLHNWGRSVFPKGARKGVSKTSHPVRRKIAEGAHKGFSRNRVLKARTSPGKYAILKVQYRRAEVAYCFFYKPLDAHRSLLRAFRVLRE